MHSHLVPTSLEVFDFAEQGMVTGSRDTTTVATQSLYLLNDPFVRSQSLELATKLLKRSEMDDAERIDRVYRLTLGRAPVPREIDRAANYLADYEAAAKQLGGSAARPDRNDPAAPEPKMAVADAPKAAVADATPQATNESGGTSSAANAKGAEPVNPDIAVPPEVIVKEEAVQASDPKTQAWASFCQALLGSAEFRYVK